MVAFIESVNAEMVVEYAGNGCGWTQVERSRAAAILQGVSSTRLDEYDLKEHPAWKKNLETMLRSGLNGGATNGILWTFPTRTFTTLPKVSL
jgi:hypothetical protein